MKQLMSIQWRPFEVYLGKFFHHRTYQVEVTSPTHDKGADLILIQGWEKTVVSAKHWKENVGMRALQEIIAAKVYYNANKAIVITLSKFSESTKKDAEALGVELWDGLRLLQEIYKDQFFDLPE